MTTPVPVAEAVLLRLQLMDPPYDTGALPPVLLVAAAEGGVGGVYVEVGRGAGAPVPVGPEGGVGGVYVEVGRGAGAPVPVGAEGGVGGVYVEVGRGAGAPVPPGTEVEGPPEGGALDEPPDDGRDGVVEFVPVLPENLPAMHFVKSG